MSRLTSRRWVPHHRRPTTDDRGTTRGRATRAHVALRGRIGPPSQRTGPREGLWIGVPPRHRVPLGVRREPGCLRCRYRTPRRRSEIRRGGVLSDVSSAADPVGPLAHALQPHAVVHVRILDARHYREMNACYRAVNDSRLRAVVVGMFGPNRIDEGLAKAPAPEGDLDRPVDWRHQS